MQKSSKIVDDIARLLSETEYLCSKNEIQTDMLRAAIEYFVRTPFANPTTTLTLLGNIREMAAQKIDFSVLLKAGVMLGMSSDYSRFLRVKNTIRARHRLEMKYVAELKNMLDLLQHEGFVGYICNLLAPSLYVTIIDKSITNYRRKILDSCELGIEHPNLIFYWDQMPDTFRILAPNLAPGGEALLKRDIVDAKWEDVVDRYYEEQMSRIKKILKIDTEQWRIEAIRSLEGELSVSICPVDSEIRCIQVEEDPFFRRSVFGSVVLFVDEDISAESENLVFISIYQKCVLNHGLHRVNRELEHYFAVKEKRMPNGKELENLRMKYYKFIRKAYPSEMAELSNSVEEPFVPRYLVGSPMHVREKPNVFHLKSRPYRADHAKNPYIEGKMLYDMQRKCYWLMPGSRLDIRAEDCKTCPCMKKLYEQASSTKCIAEHDVNASIPIKTENGDGEKNEPNIRKVKVTFVHKKIQVPSATLAAHMVLGYKRNGLDCWKNSQGQTLRAYLESIGHFPARKVSSRSASPPPEDQEEHQSVDSATPETR